MILVSITSNYKNNDLHKIYAFNKNISFKLLFKQLRSLDNNFKVALKIYSHLNYFNYKDL